MAADRLWSFAKDNILSLLSVVAGMIVFILQVIGAVSTDVVANTTLALVTLLATSEIVERQGRLSRIESKLKEDKEAIANRFDALIVKRLSVTEAYEYMRYLVLSSNKSIHWASLETRRGSPVTFKRPYEDALDAVAKRGQVRITWITIFDGKARAERARRLIFENKDKPNVFVGHLDIQAANFPLFSFVIFDEKTLIVRAPYLEGGIGDYSVISSPSIVGLFQNYFNRFLELSKKLDATESTQQFLQKALDR